MHSSLRPQMSTRLRHTIDRMPLRDWRRNLNDDHKTQGFDLPYQFGFPSRVRAQLNASIAFLATSIFHPGIDMAASGFSGVNPAALCHDSISVLDQFSDALVRDK